MSINEENNIEIANEDKNGEFLSEIYSWMDALVFAVLCVIIVFTFLFRVVGVEGESMIPTLHSGQRVIISNLMYQPKNGDVVVLCKPNVFGKPFIKRVIATEGQTVNIDYNDGSVYVDGVQMEEPYINDIIRNYGDVSMPVTVPKGQIFVMGDNRNHSTDSRSTMIGMVDTRYCMGRLLVKMF